VPVQSSLRREIECVCGLTETTITLQQVNYVIVAHPETGISRHVRHFRIVARLIIIIDQGLIHFVPPLKLYGLAAGIPRIDVGSMVVHRCDPFGGHLSTHGTRPIDIVLAVKQPIVQAGLNSGGDSAGIVG